jgi:hypothetical protein
MNMEWIKTAHLPDYNSKAERAKENFEAKRDLSLIAAEIRVNRKEQCTNQVKVEAERIRKERKVWHMRRGNSREEGMEHGSRYNITTHKKKTKGV